MGKALYREYRPRTLADVAGQPHITGALERALSKGVISHAYLFTGPRGVGKTSVARILAYQVNGLPYDETGNHLDIIEIDAASNRGIDEARELRNRVTIAPTSAKYKVYIIDEVHMLTTPAFNALLKTLEEPPAHAIFILATTEVHKVPETIISRTQHYAFRSISNESIVAHLTQIAKSEGIVIEKKALEVLAMHGGGSFRDSIGLLDQVRHTSDKITADDVRRIFGIAPENAINSIVDAIAAHDAPAVHAAILSVVEQGITASSLASQLARNLRNDTHTNQYRLPAQQTLDILAKLIEVAPSPNPEITLEVTLLGAALENAPQPIVQQTVSRPVSEQSKPMEPKAATPKPKPVVAPVEAVVAANPLPVVVPEPTQPIVATVNPDFASAWQEVLLQIKKSQYTLYGVLRMAGTSVEGNQLTLIFRFKLHQGKVNDAKNKDIVTEALKQITGENYSITCTVGEVEANAQVAPAVKATTSETPKAETGSLSTISNIFGGGELLES